MDASSKFDPSYYWKQLTSEWLFGIKLPVLWVDIAEASLGQENPERAASSNAYLV